MRGGLGARSQTLRTTHSLFCLHIFIISVAIISSSARVIFRKRAWTKQDSSTRIASNASILTALVLEGEAHRGLSRSLSSQRWGIAEDHTFFGYSACLGALKQVQSKTPDTSEPNPSLPFRYVSGMLRYPPEQQGSHSSSSCISSTDAV